MIPPSVTDQGRLDTPVGRVMISVSDAGLAAIDFLSGTSPGQAHGSVVSRWIRPTQDEHLLGQVMDELARYFRGALTRFTVPVDLTGVSEFTQRVLDATVAIPHGETRSYGQIASAIGSPGATQAVGNALGANPIPIVLPCHRVIRGDGRMGWYTGGPEIKRRLLQIEGIHYPAQQTLDL